jgi:hypothetical protein
MRFPWGELALIVRMSRVYLLNLTTSSHSKVYLVSHARGTHLIPFGTPRKDSPMLQYLVWVSMSHLQVLDGAVGLELTDVSLYGHFAGVGWRWMWMWVGGNAVRTT